MTEEREKIVIGRCPSPGWEKDWIATEEAHLGRPREEERDEASPQTGTQPQKVQETIVPVKTF